MPIIVCRPFSCLAAYSQNFRSKTLTCIGWPKSRTLRFDLCAKLLPSRGMKFLSEVADAIVFRGRVDAVRQENSEGIRRHVQPDRCSREAGVPKRVLRPRIACAG